MFFYACVANELNVKDRTPVFYKSFSINVFDYDANHWKVETLGVRIVHRVDVERPLDVLHSTVNYLRVSSKLFHIVYRSDAVNSKSVTSKSRSATIIVSQYFSSVCQA